MESYEIMNELDSLKTELELLHGKLRDLYTVADWYRGDYFERDMSVKDERDHFMYAYEEMRIKLSQQIDLVDCYSKQVGRLAKIADRTYKKAEKRSQ